MKNSLIPIVLILLQLPLASSAQLWVRAEVQGSDTIPMRWLSPVTVVDELPSTTRNRYVSNSKLVRNIKHVMPYAVECARRLQEIDAHVATIEDKREQKRYMKQAEKDLKEEFEDDLRKMTYSQGKLLIKLIDRECGRSSYDLIKFYKSGRSAVFWNGFAGLFGVTLKEEYDPKEEQQIEVILSYLGYE